MGTNRKRLLNNLSTLEAFLAGVSGVHSYHLMSGAFSLGAENIEERTPTDIHDGFRQMMVFHHMDNLKVFNHYAVIPLGIRLCRLEMVITPLTADLEMGLGSVTSGFAASVAPLLATTQLTLLASESLLRGSVKPGGLNRIPLGVSQETFQPNVYTDIMMFTVTGSMLRSWFILACDENIPVTIGTQDQVHHLGRPLDWLMHLDLEGLSQLRRNSEMLVVLVQGSILAVLPKLNGVLLNVNYLGPPATIISAGL
jgi:hypothetical protein